MTAAIVFGLLPFVFLVVGPHAEPQQRGKITRLGYLSISTEITAAENAFRNALRDLGHIEGQNLVIERRSAGGNVERLRKLASELVALNVDAIVVTNIQAAETLKKTTETIPIIFAIAQDPVANGLVKSLAKPGGNLTGVTDFARELAGKRLELLKQAAPKMSRLAVLSWKPAGPDYEAERKAIEIAAQAAGVRVESVEIRGVGELENVFSLMKQANADGLMGLTDTRFATHRKRVVQLSGQNRLPAVYQDRAFVEDGGLMSYGTNRAEWRRRIAFYVDNILKGAKPAELPVERPRQFRLVINLKTASQIGVTIPPTVLARADRVIK